MNSTEVLSSKSGMMNFSKKDMKAETYSRNEKGRDVRHQNIVAAKAVSDIIRTSLGPRGMDKMIQDSRGGVIITNDGATILNEITITHPSGRMLVELSKSQDVEAGDGTTSVVVICGALLEASQFLLDKGVHPQAIASAFLNASTKCIDILKEIAIPVDLEDRDVLIKNASTALNSKVVCQNAPLLAPIAVDAVLKVHNNLATKTVDLRDIRVVKKLGGTVDDCALIDGLVFSQQQISRRAGGPTRIHNAKIGLIQFCLSPPKTDMENNITVKDYHAMDRLLKEERLIIAKMVKHIAATGCNVLLIQKSILRDAVTNLALDYLAKANILVIRDIERDEVDFIYRTCGCQPVASLDHFTADKLGSAEMVSDELSGSGSRIVRISGVPSKTTVSILVRASNALMLDETDRSLHDALCVVRSLVKNRALLPGGGASEMQLSVRLNEWSRSLSGLEQLCVKTYAEALNVIPYTLAENAGLNPLEIITELRNKHTKGNSTIGINIKSGTVTDMLKENVVQPFLVTESCIKLATETVTVLLKIDDSLLTR